MRAGTINTAAAVSLIGLCTALAPAATLELGGGTLQLSGSLAASDTLVRSGAILAGSGTVDGNLDLAGTLSPGSTVASVGIITITGDLNCQPGSRFVCDVTSHVNGDTVFADQVSGTCTVQVRQTGGAIPVELEIVNGNAGSAYAGFVLGASQSNSWGLASIAGDLLLTDLVGDTDGDNLGDWWELKYFSGRTNATAEADGDSDHADNLSEYIAGTDPGNPLSRFAITSVVDSNDAVVVTWASSTGRVYRISRTADLSTEFLPIASNIAATPAYNTYRDEDIINETSYFYRIEIE